MVISIFKLSLSHTHTQTHKIETQPSHRNPQLHTSEFECHEDMGEVNESRSLLRVRFCCRTAPMPRLLAVAAQMWQKNNLITSVRYHKFMKLDSRVRGICCERTGKLSELHMVYCRAFCLPGALYTSLSRFSLSVNGAPLTVLWVQLWQIAWSKSVWALVACTVKCGSSKIHSVVGTEDLLLLQERDTRQKKTGLKRG